MKLNYNITDDDYVEVIEYQMNLQKNKQGEVVKFWGSNLIFCGMAIYFLAMRSNYSWIVRVAPLIMALILLGITSCYRYCINSRAQRALKSYKRANTLQKGYLGKHTLLVENGLIKRNFGMQWLEIGCEEVGRIERLKRLTILIARGVIFEMIPNVIMDIEGNQEKLFNEIEIGKSKNVIKTRDTQKQEIPQEDIKVETRCKMSRKVYAKGIVQGHRKFYTTKAAWKSNQFVCMLILLYGVILMVGGWDIYIGLSFILIGLYLNRRIISTFTPLSKIVVEQQMIQMVGIQEDIGDEVFYITNKEFIVTCCKQLQRTELKNIIEHRSSKEFQFIYTKDAQMYVIPHNVFSTESEKNRFYSLIV